MVLSLMLLALAGGDCVDDPKVLEADEGFCRVLERIESEASSSRWRTAKPRTIPSPSSVFNTYEMPVHGAASIPHSPHVGGFIEVNRDMIASIQKNDPVSTATLDMDATLMEGALLL